MKKEVRNKLFEKCGGRCAYCGCLLLDDWQVDHIVSKCHWYKVSPEDLKAVDNIENLNPSCKECNHYKRSHCVDSFGFHVGFREYMKGFHKRVSSIPKKTIRPQTIKRKAYMMAIANRYGITVDKPFDGTFYFEKMNVEQNDKRSVATSAK